MHDCLNCPFLDFCPPSHHQQSSTDWQWLFWWMAGGPAHTAATCSDNKSPFNQLASITFTFITHHQQHVQTTKTHVILSLSQFEERYLLGNVTSYHVLVLTYFAKPSSDLWQSSEVGIEEFPGEKTASCTSSSLAAKSLMTANIWRFIYILCCAYSCWKQYACAKRISLFSHSSPTDIVCHLYIVYVCIYVHIFM